MKFFLRKRFLALVLLFVTAVYSFDGIDLALVRKSFISLQSLQQFGTLAYVGREAGRYVDNLFLMKRLGELPKEDIQAFLRQRRAHDRPVQSERADRKPNIVILQMESIEANALNAQLDGKYVMDFMRKLAGEKLYFDNVIDQAAGGRTSDAEFLVLTSQVPLRDAPVYTSQDLSIVPSLPKALNEAGYRTVSMHGYKGEFWNRKNNHRKLGFQESYFLEDMENEERLGWGVSDFAAVDRSLDLVESSEEPLFLFTVLLTSHHPYNYVRHEFKLEDRGIVHDYLYSLSYVDDAIERFFVGMEERGLLEDTIVIVYGDHDSGLGGGLNNHVTELVDAADGVQEILFVAHGLSESGKMSRPFGLQDVGPTLLNEIGVPVPGTFVGNHFSVDHSILLPSNRTVERVAGNDFILGSAPVDLQYMALLAMHKPDDLTTGGDE
ncbi:MAG: LTA synthase family protein [Proteobacteria bacterium]|nr:LTA synthase family protein [Pseudomonadota bacterium]